ncbi:MAG: hypothetical protein Q7T03_05395 [Deltaproteobacteria bacterium]|nr:hypothetical protein [Deltaproteobacteria bacterium]
MPNRTEDRWYAGLGGGILNMAGDYRPETKISGGHSFAVSQNFCLETGPSASFAPNHSGQKTRLLGGWSGALRFFNLAVRAEMGGGVHAEEFALRSGVGLEGAAEFDFWKDSGLRFFIRPEAGVNMPRRTPDWVILAGADFYQFFEKPSATLPRATVAKVAPAKPATIPDPTLLRQKEIALLDASSKKAEREERFDDALRIEKDLRDKNAPRPARVFYLQMMKVWIEQESLSSERLEEILNVFMRSLILERNFPAIVDGLDLFFERTMATMGPEGEKTYINTLFIIRNAIAHFNSHLDLEKIGHYPGVPDGIRFFAENIRPFMEGDSQ